MSIRSSASLLLVAPSNLVLFMRRPTKASYPTAHVFPGGVVEKEDPSLPYTALRETYEETGLLIAPGTPPQVVSGTKYASYDEALRAEVPNASSIDWQADPSVLGLEPISRWVTPPTYKKRFSTQFYVCKVPRTVDLSHVKNDEVDLLEWLTPAEVLTRFKEKQVTLIPPQFYLMNAIRDNGLEGAVAALRNRVFEPRPLEHSKERTLLDWGKGEKGLLLRDTAGIVRSIELIRSKI
ncbi:hypothetical protein TRVA0_008S00276 [Trichomonascus vanleenenianus]|uniref:NUDIX hydrolase n=1 Tax=Trichomonascus vanleenenianus TaxID=2268995 RepID=UPI003ECADECC